MQKIVVLVSCLCLLAACSHVSKESSAGRRAARLNASKSEARALVDEGRYREALAVLEPLSEEASGDHQLFVMLGDSYRGLERFDDATRAYESAIRLAYYDHHTHLKLANLLMEHGKSGRALTEFKLAAEFGENDPVARYDYGLALYQMGRKETALEEWRAAYALDSGNATYAEAMGIGLTETDPEEAIGFFEQAQLLGADDASHHHNFGLALREAGFDGRALGQFERAVEIEPDSEAYRFTLAATYSNTRRYSKAIAQWDSLAQRFGETWEYSVYRGRALLEAGRYADAIASIEPAISAFESGDARRNADRAGRPQPILGDALEILAMAYRGAEDLPRALECVERAVALEPDNVSYLNNYGVILAENGRIPEAKAQWIRVLEIDADNATARRNLSAFEP